MVACCQHRGVGIAKATRTARFSGAALSSDGARMVIRRPVGSASSSPIVPATVTPRLGSASHAGARRVARQAEPKPRLAASTHRKQARATARRQVRAVSTTAAAQRQAPSHGQRFMQQGEVERHAGRHEHRQEQHEAPSFGRDDGGEPGPYEAENTRLVAILFHIRIIPRSRRRRRAHASVVRLADYRMGTVVINTAA